jgi:hypothetical protein
MIAKASAEKFMKEGGLVWEELEKRVQEEFAKKNNQ